MNVIINAEREDQAAGQQNGEQSSRGEPETRGKMMPTGCQRNRESQEEREKNRDAAESRKGMAVQVALQSWCCHPSVCGRQIAHVLGQNERK